jgi:hypothetical protein
VHEHQYETLRKLIFVVGSPWGILLFRP